MRKMVDILPEAIHISRRKLSGKDEKPKKPKKDKLSLAEQEPGGIKKEKNGGQ